MEDQDRSSAGVPRHDPLFAPQQAPGGGMSGTTPADVYRPPHERELHTIAPDGRPADQQPAWRRDFPIDWPQDHYVARRDFTKFLVLISGAFAVGQVVIGLQSWLRRRRGPLPAVKVASLSALPAGGAVTFKYPGRNDD